ncbi:MAG: hypothetical protein LCH41_13710 [Armatimonadetes bacterium]|nr:hypothetical protein [Armatimonadota bacterium]
MNFWEKAQKVDRRVLYAILIFFVCGGLFFPATIPVDPDPSSKSFYSEIKKLNPEKVVLIQSDWTNSTRGESMGHFENLMRLLMSQNIKFVFYSAADPVAPQVARTVITRINKEREGQGLRVYKAGVDYLDLGYFPNAEATNTNMGNNLREAWKGRKARVDGREVDIFATPVLGNVKKIEDAGMMIVVTASASIDVAIQRLAKRVPIMGLVTGVVGPGVLPFYQSGQLKGVAIGLKGVYDVEYMMANGINVKPGGEGKAKVEWDGNNGAEVPPVTEGKTLARGQQYYGTLHVALVLLILAVVMGNVSMFMARRRQGEEA